MVNMGKDLDNTVSGMFTYAGQAEGQADCLQIIGSFDKLVIKHGEAGFKPVSSSHSCLDQVTSCSSQGVDEYSGY